MQTFALVRLDLGRLEGRHVPLVVHLQVPLGGEFGVCVVVVIVEDMEDEVREAL